MHAGHVIEVAAVVAILAAAVHGGAGQVGDFARFRPEEYRRPYGPRAPWNVPVADIPRHPESDEFVDRLWEKGCNRPGNFNLSFDGYTYPVYHASDATGEYAVETRWRTNIDGTRIPWNPAWQPALGTDAQSILLDPETGREWNLWQVTFDEEAQVVRATNGNLVPGDYRTKEDGFGPSRGVGIQYLAMLVRPEEIMQGEIRHALSMPVRNTDGEIYLPPATKLEHADHPGGGIPEGMRYAIRATDEEIEEWVASLPDELPEITRRSARIIALALRDYGWFITDTSGAAHLQFEDRVTAAEEWTALGLDDREAGYKEYPRDLLDGLMLKERIYALVPSDEYPPELRAEPERGAGPDRPARRRRNSAGKARPR